MPSYDGRNDGMRTEPLQMMFRAASILNRDATVWRSAEGWRLSIVDRANVAMCDMTVPASDFPEGPGEGVFCVPAGEALELVSMARDATVTIDDGWFRVEADGMRRSLRLIQPDDDTRAMPSLDLDVSFMVDVDAMRSVATLFDAKRVGTMRISASPDALTLSAGCETADAVRTVPAEEMVSPPTGEASSEYPLDYVQQMLKAIPKGRTVEVSLAEGWPMTVDFSGDGVSARWMIAPRMTEED